MACVDGVKCLHCFRKKMTLFGAILGKKNAPQKTAYNLGHKVNVKSQRAYIKQKQNILIQNNYQG